MPILKDKLGDKSNSENYRAIAISSLLLKIFDHIILLLFSENLKSCDLQFGFLEENSTTMCTWIVTEVISYYVRNNSSVFCCLLYLKKAFDKVEFSLLFHKLKESKVPGTFIRLLVYIYLNQSCKVRWGNTLSEEFMVKNGVRQGAVLSPTLFSLYMNSLLLQLKESGIGCHVGNHYYGALAYADDIALLCPSRSGLQKMLNICEKYFNIHKIIMSTNPDIKKTKTKCLYFSHTQDKNLPAPIFCDKKPLPWVNAWQYLGNTLNINDLSKPFRTDMTSDTNNKRRKFVGKIHSLLQEFGFLDHDKSC